MLQILVGYTGADPVIIKWKIAILKIIDGKIKDFYIFEISKGAESFKLSEPPLDPPPIHFTTFQGIMFQIVDDKVRYILKGLTNN